MEYRQRAESHGRGAACPAQQLRATPLGAPRSKPAPHPAALVLLALLGAALLLSEQVCAPTASAQELEPSGLLVERVRDNFLRVEVRGTLSEDPSVLAWQLTGGADSPRDLKPSILERDGQFLDLWLSQAAQGDGCIVVFVDAISGVSPPGYPCELTVQELGPSHIASLASIIVGGPTLPNVGAFRYYPDLQEWWLVTRNGRWLVTVRELPEGVWDTGETGDTGATVAP